MFSRFWGLVPNLTMTVTVVIEEDKDSYHAYCPALRGLHVDGDTEKEALDNAIEAVSVYLRSLRHHRDPLPIGADLTLEEHYPEVPENAYRKNITLKWPSLQMSGIS